MEKLDEAEVKGVEVQLDKLIRVERITDQSTVSITRLIPIKSDGSDDTSRSVKFLGSTQFESPYGPIPVNVDLESECLKEALAKYPAIIAKEIDTMIVEVNKQIAEQNEAAASAEKPALEIVK
jgi:hypothetical protein